LEENRTGIPTYTIPAALLSHNMEEGFPLLTTRRIPYKSVRVELEGFLNGITDKRWYEERGCRYWSNWCSPHHVPYSNDPETKEKMRKCPDLGPIYPASWVDFGRAYAYEKNNCNWVIEQGVNQIDYIVGTLKSTPQSRQMVCTAWNPLNLRLMALPPCHTDWQVSVIGGKLNMFWTQRSCDYVLGIPSNMASYATLLHLLSLESGIPVGTITGLLKNVHVYENHLDGAKEMLYKGKSHDLPTIETNDFKSIYGWSHDKTSLKDYKYDLNLKFNVAV
jgi:thymidylate synthase